MVGYEHDSNSYFIKVMHGINPIKLVANVTFLRTMNYIEEFFNLLDQQQLVETRSIADTLTRLDELADRNGNFGNSNGGRSPDAFPNPVLSNVPSFGTFSTEIWEFLPSMIYLIRIVILFLEFTRQIPGYIRIIVHWVLLVVILCQSSFQVASLNSTLVNAGHANRWASRAA